MLENVHTTRAFLEKSKQNCRKFSAVSTLPITQNEELGGYSLKIWIASKHASQHSKMYRCELRRLFAYYRSSVFTISICYFTLQFPPSHFRGILYFIAVGGTTLSTIFQI